MSVAEGVAAREGVGMMEERRRRAERTGENEIESKGRIESQLRNLPG